MMAKPIRALELHYPTIQFLIIGFVVTDPFLAKIFNPLLGVHDKKTA